MVAFGELGTSPFGATSSGVGKPATAVPSVVAAPSPTLDPLRYPSAWTVVKAGGNASPGLVLLDKISGFERKETWDVKAGKGTTGATSTHTESPPAEGSFTFELWAVEHYAAWDRWLALFRFDASKKTGAAIAIYHPALASVQPPITAVVMVAHTPVKPDSRGRSEVTISLKEYLASKSTGTSTAKGATQYQKGTGATTGTQEDPAITKLKQQAAALAKQAQAVA